MLYRRRTLETPHGSLKTPVLFPVRNIGTRSKDNTPSYTNQIPDLPTAMVNARAIRDREQQWERLQNGSSLREELDERRDTIIYADSGGWQFKSNDVDYTPTEILEAQVQIGADIFGTIDLPLSRNDRNLVTQRRIKRSTRYALEASDLHDGEGLLFASVHGFQPETIRNTISYLETQGDFDGYALGSLALIRSDYEKTTKLILAARRATEKHLHVYGLGGLTYQPLILYLGVDSFDSAAFIQGAGKRHYLIPGFGGDPIKNYDSLEYPPCCCPVCHSRTLAEIRAERDLITRHNLWALTEELRRFRYVAERGKDIETYLDLRFQGNPVTQRGYQIAKQQVRRLT